MRYCEWHPTKGLIASCSKDALVKLWDPRAGGDALSSLHGHKTSIMQVHWNMNGNWLLTACRDQTLKVCMVCCGRRGILSSVHCCILSIT